MTTLQHPAQVNLFYPAEPNGRIFNHLLLSSRDGKTWARVPSADLAGVQNVEADAVLHLGYFAAARPKGVGGAPAAHHFPWVTVIFLSLAGVIAVATILGEIRSRRSKRTPPKKTGGSGPKPKPKGSKGGLPPGRR